jgi:phosphomannomutase
MSAATLTNSLRSSLQYEPRVLEFGTSGRRGKVVDLTQLEVYINALAELEYLQSLDTSEGGIVRGEEFFFARDLRPSSYSFVPEQEGRGEIAQTIVAAIRDAGMRAINLGSIPTPALTCYALARAKGSMMVTGSHIPFDRNGYKTNSSKGELLKQQEAPINEHVLKVRQRLYEQHRYQSPFDARGFFKTGHQDLPAEQPEARDAWIGRFTSFFKGASLEGMRLMVYQHSAVGRDLLVEVLERLGAQVIAAGRSETFVPIDTENIT